MERVGRHPAHREVRAQFDLLPHPLAMILIPLTAWVDSKSGGPGPAPDAGPGTSGGAISVCFVSSAFGLTWGSCSDYGVPKCTILFEISGDSILVDCYDARRRAVVLRCCK
jgi:hypothetical protein